MLKMMRLRAILFGVFTTVCVFSCAEPEPVITVPSDIQFDLPPKKKQPVLRVLDYKNRNEGAALASWLRAYLERGIAGPESLSAYRDSYLFIASINSGEQRVINQWLQNYSPDRDFSRLAAERIQRRLERNLSNPPDTVYGSNYEKALRAAYGTNFWGSRQLDDTWVYGISVVQNDDPENPNPEPEEPLYWGFILVSVPKETLEIQVSGLLLAAASGRGRAASKEQNAAFDHVRDRFFEQF